MSPSSQSLRTKIDDSGMRISRQTTAHASSPGVHHMPPGNAVRIDQECGPSDRHHRPTAQRPTPKLPSPASDIRQSRRGMPKMPPKNRLILPGGLTFGSGERRGAAGAAMEDRPRGDCLSKSLSKNGEGTVRINAGNAAEKNGNNSLFADGS